jgi:c-di-GMP-binding flagellar brake protein YcgR
MSFVLGDDFEFIKIEATVPWSREGEGCYVYGLSFSKIDDRDKDRLYQYINTHCYDQIKDKWWA